MSMISALIDELRERAKELRNLAPDPDVPYLVPSTKETIALAMRSAAGEMEDAADTIWQLRDDLQRANTENAKLREEFNKMDVWHSKELTAAMDENAKLRGLIADVREALCLDKTTLFREAIIKSLENDMRELGIEVES